MAGRHRQHGFFLGKGQRPEEKEMAILSKLCAIESLRQQLNQAAEEPEIPLMEGHVLEVSQELDRLLNELNVCSAGGRKREKPVNNLEKKRFYPVARI